MNITPAELAALLHEATEPLRRELASALDHATAEHKRATSLERILNSAESALDEKDAELEKVREVVTSQAMDGWKDRSNLSKQLDAATKRAVQAEEALAEVRAALAAQCELTKQHAGNLATEKAAHAKTKARVQIVAADAMAPGRTPQGVCEDCTGDGLFDGPGGEAGAGGFCSTCGGRGGTDAEAIARQRSRDASTLAALESPTQAQHAYAEGFWQGRISLGGAQEALAAEKKVSAGLAEDLAAEHAAHAKTKARVQTVPHAPQVGGTIDLKFGDWVQDSSGEFSPVYLNDEKLESTDVCVVRGTGHNARIIWVAGGDS